MLPPPSDDEAQAEALIRTAVRAVLSATDFAAAFDAFCRDLPSQAPVWERTLPADADRRRSLLFGMFRSLWDQTPQPDNDWRPRPLPKTERNAPCPCGSGRKYKQCCGDGTVAAPFDGGEINLLGFVLDGVAREDYARLPFRKLSPDALADVAETWLDQDRYEDAVALLEPLLADPTRLDARHEFAFDLLCDAYLDLDQGEARRELAQRIMQAPDRDLKSAATHRYCTMLADDGDYTAAWQLFKEAQRQDADNPGLAQLELSLLAGEGELARIGERARFWATRLRRLGYAGEPIVDLMDSAAADPAGFAARFEAGFADDEALDAELLERLSDLVEALPAPACHYRLEPQDGAAGPLEADTQLATVERQWREHFPEAGSPWDDTAWLDWLAAHPLAWQSFEVLGDLAAELADAPFADDQGDTLDAIEEALLDHAVALLRIVIAANQADGCTLEWSWLQNRSALRLIAHLANLARHSEEEIPLLEWLVLTLNPNDNQGLRERLVHTLIAADRSADALAVCARYPNDALSGMIYGHILALYSTGRLDEASAALKAARKHSPAIFNFLTAAKPTQPKLNPGYVTHGGDDEAWHYRRDWLDLWQRSGAFDWLSRVARGK